MKKILIVAPYCSLPGDKPFNRFLFMAKLLSENGHKVTLVTSCFVHQEKKFRDRRVFSEKFDIQQLSERGYSTNLCVKRVFSINDFTKNFSIWFDANHDFDVVISAYPLIGTNLAIVKRKSAFNFKYILDVQDVWPESIASAVPLFRFIPKRILPFSKQADIVYKNADAIVAVSSTYLERALEASSTKLFEVLYIGAEFNRIKQVRPHLFRSKKIRMFYIGALGPSYDIETVILACNRLHKEGLPVELHIMGIGKELEFYKKIAGDSVVFHGQVPYEKMFGIMKGCDIALNAVTSNATQSVTNKLSDYLAIGCPIINSSNNKEVLTLLDNRNATHYTPGSVSSFCSAFHALTPSLCEKWVPDYRFDREKTYRIMLSVINSLLEK